MFVLLSGSKSSWGHVFSLLSGAMGACTRGNELIISSVRQETLKSTTPVSSFGDLKLSDALSNINAGLIRRLGGRGSEINNRPGY